MLVKGWQFRWFILDSNNAILSYYTSKENMSKGERRGCIRLKDAFIGYDNEDDVTFSIKTDDDKTFHLQATNLEERKKWVVAIERSIRYHKSTNFDLNSFGFNTECELSAIMQRDFDSKFSLEEKSEQILNESQKYIEIMSKSFKVLKLFNSNKFLILVFL